jgi:hypothetical protein
MDKEQANLIAGLLAAILFVLLVGRTAALSPSSLATAFGSFLLLLSE